MLHDVITWFLNKIHVSYIMDNYNLEKEIDILSKHILIIQNKLHELKEKVNDG